MRGSKGEPCETGSPLIFLWNDLSFDFSACCMIMKPRAAGVDVGSAKSCPPPYKDSIPLKFPLDKRPVWGYTYHNGICPCEIRRKRTVPPMGVVEAQRMESPGYRPCRIFTE